MSRPLHRWILLYVIDPSLLAPLLGYAWSRFRGGYQWPPWFTAFAWVLGFDLIQGATAIGLALSHHNNQWLRHGTQPVVFAGLLWVLAQLPGSSAGFRRLVAICGGVGLLAAVVGVFVNGLFWRNALFTVTQSLIYSGLGALGIKRLLEHEETELLTQRPEFWLNAAILVYGSSTLVFNATSNHFLRTLPPHLLHLPWTVNGLVIVLYQLSLAKVFLCRKPTSS